MIKVYGMPDCPYCQYIKPQLDERFVYINIGDSIEYLYEYVKLRDTNPAFDKCKEEDDLGLPCFVREDGTVSLKPEDFDLEEYSGKSSCSLENKGHC